MTNLPLVSVVMAVRNGEPYFDAALASIRDQTYDNVEIVVVDGASTDRSVEIAEAHGARCETQHGTGLGGAWNQGLAAARGELICFLDSDDLWGPEKLGRQVELFAEDPALQCVHGTVRFFLEPGFDRPSSMRPAMFEGEHLARMPGAVMVRRSVFDAVGVFPTDLAVAVDVDWFARLKDSGLKATLAPAALIHKRVHDHNLSVTGAEQSSRELVRLLRDSVHRQRGMR